MAVVGTGGLSHQVHGERCGFNNTEWDMEFIERLEKEPESLTDMTIAELAKLGGYEGAEVVMWMLMRGALADRVEKIHQTYYLPSMTPICSIILEERSEDGIEEGVERYMEQVDHQLDGIHDIEGTYPFTIERSVKAYRLNKFLHDLVYPEQRKLFRTDQEAAFEQAGLSEEEREMVRNLDWRAMIHYGVIFFMLEKLGAVVGTSNLHIYAAMKDMTLDDFQQTRNAQVTYSVAGKED